MDDAVVRLELERGVFDAGYTVRTPDLAVGGVAIERRLRAHEAVDREQVSRGGQTAIRVRRKSRTCLATRHEGDRAERDRPQVNP